MDLLKTDGDSSLQVLWEDGERVVRRGWRLHPDGNRSPVLAVRPAVEHPTPATLDSLAHEYGLRGELHESWAVRPLQLVRHQGQITLVLEDPGGEETVSNLGGLPAISPGGRSGGAQGKRDDQGRDDLPALFSPQI